MNIVYRAAELLITSLGCNFEECIIQASHLKDLQSGAMITNRLIGLYITIQQRRNK